MTNRARLKPSAFILIILMFGILAAGNMLVLSYALAGQCAEWLPAALADLAAHLAPGGVPAWVSSLDGGMPWLSCQAVVVGAPLAMGLLLLVGLPRLVASGEGAHPARSAVASEQSEQSRPVRPGPAPGTAVELLAVLQREGRLVDFLREDIQPYSDAQVGAAVRTIHQACRQVLQDHLALEPVLDGREGDEVTVDERFDPSAIRLTGNVSGNPPFRGALRHAGWRAGRVDLPELPRGQDAGVIAPAEVEMS